MGHLSICWYVGLFYKDLGLFYKDLGLFYKDTGEAE